jgi:hypothetical protein
MKIEDAGENALVAYRLDENDICHLSVKLTQMLASYALKGYSTEVVSVDAIRENSNKVERILFYYSPITKDIK